MDGFAKSLLRKCWNLQIQFVRHRNKINITKPRPLHFKRDVVEHLCVPYFNTSERPPNVPHYELCNINFEKKTEKEDPLEDILGKEVLNKLNHSKLIAIFHLNFLDEEEEFENEVFFKNNGLKLLKFEKEVIEKGLTGTIYEPILKFYQSYTTMAIGQEPNIYHLLQVVKKTPKFILLAAVVNNRRLLDIREITDFGKQPNLESARLSFLTVLNGLSINLVQGLNYFPNSIVHCFDQHKKLNFCGQ